MKKILVISAAFFAATACGGGAGKENTNDSLAAHSTAVQSQEKAVTDSAQRLMDSVKKMKDTASVKVSAIEVDTALPKK